VEEIMLRRLAYCAVVAGTTAVAASGCGNGGGTAAGSSAKASPSPMALVAGAYANTINAGSASLAMTDQISAGTKTTSATGKGVVSFKPPASAVTFTEGDKSSEIRTIGKDSYFHLAGHGWRKVDRSGLGGGDMSQNSSPSSELSFLNAISDATPTGAATIRGARTQAYRVTIDLNKVAAQASPEQQKVFRGLVKANGSGTVSADVWLDSQHRVARERYVLALTTGGKKTKITSTLDLYDFGSPVKVTPPPHSQVTTTETPKPN
jgi:hypothetical protein